MQIQYTDKIDITNGVKALVYGPSGSGKTVLSATAEAPFIFSAEEGLLSLRKTRVAYATIKTYKDLMDAYTWAIKSPDTKAYKTFVLDSVSEIAEVVLAEEMRKNKDPRKAYGEMQQQMYTILRAFRDIPGKNVVFIGKQILTEYTEGFQSYKKASPLMPSAALQNQVPYFFDLVLHLYVGTDASNGTSYRALHTQPSKDFDAKDRSGNLDAIERPNLDFVFKKACA